MTILVWPVHVPRRHFQRRNPMIIIDIIREAETEHDVYFLLTAYVEAVRFGDKLNCLSEPMTRLPFTGMDDVSGRFEKLVAELDVASRRLDDNTCEVIKEALHVFGTALNRLRSLAGERHASPAEIYRHAA